MPLSRIRNFSIIAHIDHGKSTLADRILQTTQTVAERDMRAQLLDSMDLEREKGITIKARAVRLEYKARDGLIYGLNLIDTPGHVDFAYEVSHSLQACEGAILVVDATQGIEAQTLANVHLAIREGLSLIPVLNKIDLPSADPAAVMDELENVLAIPREEVLLASAKDGTGVPEILEAIVARIPAPKGDPTRPLKGLIFDSHYDAYKGVVVYVRLAQGTLRHGEAIRLMASGAEADPLELGVFRPGLVPVRQLVAGEVGYVATGLKSVRDAQVGDTVTTVSLTHGSSIASMSTGAGSRAGLSTATLPRPRVRTTWYSTEGADAIRLRPNSRSRRSWTISMWSRPRNPQRKPNPSARELSGSYRNAASFSASFSTASRVAS